MHICFITSEFPKKGFPHGGVGTFVKTISQQLIKRGIKVSVVGLNYVSQTELEEYEGIKIYRIKPSRIKGLAWYFNNRAIFKTIKEIHSTEPIDVIETSELGLAFLEKIKSVKYIIRLHGGHHFFSEAENRSINWWRGWQEKRSFKKADAFIAVSEYVQKHTEKYLSYHHKPIAVIFYPIDTISFSPKLNEGIDKKEKAIVFAGTICEKKGVRQLIQALPKIKESFPDAILHLYGRDWQFPDGSSYITMLKNTELPKIKPYDTAVVFHGSIAYETIPEVYAKASVCVFPSHMETLGLVAPEAMAMEQAVIFTNLGPGPEVIQDKVDGLLVNPHQPNAIADAVLWVFNHPNEVKEIALNARKSVLKKFDPNAIALENITWYSKIINNASN